MTIAMPNLVIPKDMPDWRKLLATDPDLWARSLQTAKAGPRVLIATNVGGHGPVNIFESMLAIALTLRGANVYSLLCDGVLPGCLRAEHSDFPDPAVLVERRLPEVACKGCMWRGESMVLPLGTGLERIGTNLTAEEKKIARDIADSAPYEKIGSYQFEGLSVGEHAKAGALRYFARGDLSTEPQGEPVMRRYLEAAILSAFATRRCIREKKIEIAVFHHGLYVPQGVVGEVCRQEGVRVVNWYVSYRKSTVIFSHEDTYHHTLMSEPVETWQNMTWSSDHSRDIDAYLGSRWHGSRDWISFHEKPADLDKDFQAFIEATGLDLSKPVIGMLTNVVWDAQLHYPANAFPGMIEWVMDTIEYFSGRPDLQLLMRVHPAEIRGTAKSRQPILDDIKARFPKLPDNVFIIPPESAVSTYRAMEHCDSVIIFGTKTGVELTSMGIPTIVAGEAWIRGKGLTLDAESPQHYHELLDQLPLGTRLDETTRELARKYAYHFFFRRMIPVSFLKANGKSTLFEVDLDKLGKMLPGNFKGLDTICEGILDAKPFVFPAEKMPEAISDS